VAIPFFRKNKNKPADAPAKVEAEPDATQLLGTIMPGNGGIVVEDTGGANTAVDEAAILYASNQPDAAEAALKSVLGSDDVRAWHMLFDLYRIQGRVMEFEHLALDYALRSERSPPVWVGDAQIAQTETPAVSASLPGLLDARACASLRAELAQAGAQAVIRLDFAQINMVDEAGAKECAAILASAPKKQWIVQVSGVDRLIALLLDLNRATHARAAHWQFLLELYQLLGWQEKFEDLAVDYAVHFEVSPPSWIDAAPASIVQTRVPAPVVDGEVLHLVGEISPANDQAFASMEAWAATHPSIVLDLSALTRIDYASVSHFISLLMQWLGNGKTIIINGHHALIHELFRVMGIDQLAQLNPAGVRGEA
jgi:anti-anti-sigma regulatory factor